LWERKIALWERFLQLWERKIAFNNIFSVCGKEKKNCGKNK